MAGHLKRIFSAFLAFVFVGGIGQGLSVSAASQYAKEISIYSLKSEIAKRITIPSKYNTEYQLNPSELGLTGSGTPTYKKLSASEANYSGSDYSYYAIDLSNNGLVTDGHKTWYLLPSGEAWSYPVEGYIDTYSVPINGTVVVRVTLGNSYKDVLVHHYNYASIYAQEYTDKFIEENAKPNMTVQEIADLGGKYAASFVYSIGASTAEDMIVSGGGDCWGSTAIVMMICERYGINSWPRNGRKDELAGGGHRNAMVEDSANGVWYEVEAGYGYDTAPRYYQVKTRTSLFSYRKLSGNNIEVYSYDINPELQDDLKSITFPSKIDGKTVTSIGSYFLDPSFNQEKINRIYIPKTITNIAQYAFGDCDTLTDIYYEGTEAEWNAITIGNGNEIVQNATVHCSTASLPKPAQVKFTSLALDDRIGVRFKLELPDEFLNDSGAYVEVNGTRCQIEEFNNETYPVQYSVAVPDIDKELVLRLYKGDGSLYPLLNKSGVDVTADGFKYSANEYIKSVTSSGSVSENTIIVLKRLKDFSKKSKLYFNRTDNIGSYSDLSGDINSVKASDLVRYASEITTATNAGITRKGTSLALEAATEINHKFVLDSGKNISDYKFYVNETLVTTTSSGNYRLWYDSDSGKYVLTIKGIAPSHLQDAFLVVIKDKSNKEVLRISNYSALSYVYSILSKAEADSSYASSKAKLTALIKSMFLYNRAAMIRFNVTEPVAAATTGTSAVNASDGQPKTSDENTPEEADPEVQANNDVSDTVQEDVNKTGQSTSDPQVPENTNDNLTDADQTVPEENNTDLNNDDGTKEQPAA